MTESHYCLRWRYHQSNLISEFLSLLGNKTLVDVTLTAEGKNLKAHKVILSACSPYFKELFEENLAPHPVLIFKDISFNDLKSVVEFIYSGKIELGLDNFQSVIKAAETLRVNGLLNLPAEAIRAEFQAKKRASSDSSSNHRAKRKKCPTRSLFSSSNSTEPAEGHRSADNSEIEKSSDVKPNLMNIPNDNIQTRATVEISSSVPTDSRLFKTEDDLDERSRAVTAEDDESSDFDLTLSPERPSSMSGLLENDGLDNHTLQRQDSLELTITKKGCELSDEIMSEKDANTQTSIQKFTNTETILMPSNEATITIRPYKNKSDYNTESNCILMENLPVPITKLDVANFFRPVKTCQIFIVLDTNSRQTGKCYCEFLNKTDTMKAISEKNHALMIEKSVTLTIVPKREMLQAITFRTAKKTYPNIYPNKPILSLLASRLKSPEALRPYNNARSRLSPYAKQPVQITKSPQTAQNFGSPDCTVSLKNVPFRCGVDEILKFFYKFRVQRKDVDRKFSEDGLPTDTFRVRLPNPFMAQQAVQHLNGEFIEKRKISVRLLKDVME